MKLTSKLFLLYLGAIFIVHLVRTDTAESGSVPSGSSAAKTSPPVGITTSANIETNSSLKNNTAVQGNDPNTSTVSTSLSSIINPKLDSGTTQAPLKSSPKISDTTDASSDNSPATTEAQTSVTETKVHSTSTSTATPTTKGTSSSSVLANTSTITPLVTTTVRPTTTNISGTSEKNPATTQSPPPTTQNLTETTANNGSQTISSTATSPSSSKNNESSTKPSTTTVSSQTSSSTAASTPASKRHMYINEIMLNKQGGFQTIELNVANPVDLTHFAMVMVDGGTNKTMVVRNFTDTQQTNNLVMVTLSNNTDAMMKTKGIGIAIYNIDQVSTLFKDDWTVNSDGLVDALVIGRSYETISSHLVQTLTPGMNPFVLDPSLYGKDRTISRCSFKMTCNTDMFALVNPSLGSDNNNKCQERLHYQEKLGVKFTANCTMFNTSNTKDEESMIHYIIREVNRKCHCGFTRMHIKDPLVQCCKFTNLEMNFVAPNENQKETLLSYYKAFIHSTTDIAIDGYTYKIDNSCYSNCCAAPAPSTGEDKDKNTRVTVAVVVTCMLIFLIIVILVVLYMRKKKTAVYQFRMSRLEEEDDYPMGVGDHDEFVGGQEATFDIKT